MRTRVRGWCAEHPHVSVHLEEVSNKAPLVVGHYDLPVSGTDKVIDVNGDCAKRVEKQMSYLVNSTGRKPSRITSNHFRATPSIQGPWAPNVTEGVEFKVTAM